MNRMTFLEAIVIAGSDSELSRVTGLPQGADVIDDRTGRVETIEKEDVSDTEWGLWGILSHHLSQERSETKTTKPY